MARRGDLRGTWPGGRRQRHPPHTTINLQRSIRRRHAVPSEGGIHAQPVVNHANQLRSAFSKSLSLAGNEPDETADGPAMSRLSGPARGIYGKVQNRIRASLRPAVALPIVATAILASTLLFQRSE